MVDGELAGAHALGWSWEMVTEYALRQYALWIDTDREVSDFARADFMVNRRHTLARHAVPRTDPTAMPAFCFYAGLDGRSGSSPCDEKVFGGRGRWKACWEMP